MFTSNMKIDYKNTLKNIVKLYNIIKIFKKECELNEKHFREILEITIKCK